MHIYVPLCFLRMLCAISLLCVRTWFVCCIVCGRLGAYVYLPVCITFVCGRLGAYVYLPICVAFVRGPLGSYVHLPVSLPLFIFMPKFCLSSCLISELQRYSEYLFHSCETKFSHSHQILFTRLVLSSLV